VRAFIAIDLDSTIKESLLDLLHEVRAARADIRWVSQGGMHLTLKFLGPIDECRVEKIKDVMTGVAAQHRSFPLELKDTGAFPGERSPRVLWVGVAAGPELAALQADLEASLAKEGFEREMRDFHPHLTLGRVKGPSRVDKAMAELSRHRGESFGSMTATRLTLFESLLHPEGAEYRVVFEAPLP
jgi:2'-5' RNA ligase